LYFFDLLIIKFNAIFFIVFIVKENKITLQKFVKNYYFCAVFYIKINFKINNKKD